MIIIPLEWIKSDSPAHMHQFVSVERLRHRNGNTKTFQRFYSKANATQWTHSVQQLWNMIWPKIVKSVCVLLVVALVLCVWKKARCTLIASDVATGSIDTRRIDVQRARVISLGKSTAIRFSAHFARCIEAQCARTHMRTAKAQFSSYHRGEKVLGQKLHNQMPLNIVTGAHSMRINVY